jgi:hypothetical protein
MPKYPPVTFYIEYDSRGRRVKRAFTDEYAARRFWIAKDKAGKRPRVRKN